MDPQDGGPEVPALPMLDTVTQAALGTDQLERHAEDKDATQVGRESGESPSDITILTHTHSHAQWRTIAEEFSSLLDKDFVDVVFKVRGGKYLAAHKVLLAAVWPSLRDELRKVKLPSVELRAEGLAWVTSGGQAPAAHANADGLAPGQDRQVTPITSVIAATLEPPMELGVLDVSERSWGSWSAVRSLFCHLYSRPVAIRNDELAGVRTAATNLGCLELARSCDDAASSNKWSKKGHQQKAPQDGELWGEAHNISTSAMSGGSAYASEREPSELQSGASDDGLQVGRNTPERRVWSGRGVPRDKPLEEKVEDARGNEARARARAGLAPKGETSFQREEREEGGGIRHVLSDLKRVMVESSRVISDKTFRSVYDTVDGDRGVLGEGINGPVRMAVNKRTGREVAVKRISCVNLSEQRRQMLLSEIRIFLQVSHRNIVQLLEVYESEADQAVLLVMELCTGKELFERLAERKYYSEFDAARVTRQMLDAVSYLHSQNICHRDLKLENWLYESPSQDARLKLCDFGFGQIVEPSTQLTATLGSLYYVAPEVLEGSYGLPCDMWSMGVIVFMLLTGNPPFDGKTDANVIDKIKQGRVSTGKRWEDISETAKHFLHSVLRKDPYERFSASEAAQHAWLNMEGTAKRLPGISPELSIDTGVIRDMWKFAQNNAITRAALGMLSSAGNSSTFHGAEADVVSLEQQFKRFDVNNTGKIDADEFNKVLKERLMQQSSTSATQVIERIAGKSPDEVKSSEQTQQEPKQEKRRKREVNYTEFLTMTKAKRVAYNSAAIREAFKAFDKDGEGFIMDEEIRGMLAEGFKGDEEMMKATLEKCDVNGDGLIDYVNFAAIFSEELSKKNQIVAEQLKAVALTGELDDTGAKQVLSNPSVDGEASKVATPRQPQNDPGTTPAVQAEQKAELQPSKPNLDDGAVGSPQTAPASSTLVDLPSGKEKEEEDDEHEEEGCWPGDEEEQLVSVKESDTRAPEHCNKQHSDNKGVAPANKGKQKNHLDHNFSLSLAGSSEQDDVSHGVNRIVSLPSDFYMIRQYPGFHRDILKPFYADRPVSNICIGLIRGTSLYARQAIQAKLATIIHTIYGWYFLMPNPKYHSEVNDRKGLLSKETGKFRFVAWWIHPRFVPQLRRWFEKAEQDRENQQREQAATRRERVKTEKSDKAEKLKDEMEMGVRSIRSNDLDPPSPKYVSRGTSQTAEAIRGTSQQERAKSSGEPETPLLADDMRSQPSGTASSTERPLSPGIVAGVLQGADEVQAVQNVPAQIDGSGMGIKPGPQDAGDKARGSRTEKDRDATKREPGCDSVEKEYPMGMGSPGDFLFSDVPKPDNYLHTYRDLHTREHILMLNQLTEGVQRFLRTLFDENFLASAQISAGFHYPVRTQYATLHMQVRVNSGSVCRDDGRGIDIHSLIENLQGDRLRYHRDEEPLRYQVTENIKVSLLAAANEHVEEHPEREVVRQTAPLAYDLGIASMPTINDEGEEDAQQDDSKEEALGEYIVNLQPASESRYCTYLYGMRSEIAKLFGKDPSYLYPLHTSVTGFFAATKSNIEKLVSLMHEIVSEEMIEMRGRDLVIAKEILSVNAGYVLQDVEAPAITAFANSLSLRSKDLGLNIRPKAVNHVSLAMGRPDPEQRRQIQDMYASEPENWQNGASFEIVLSRRIFRGSFDRLEVDGPHQFKEVTRIAITTPPVSSPTPTLPEVAPTVPESSLTKDFVEGIDALKATEQAT
jgi:serine/threonine protein kinase